MNHIKPFWYNLIKFEQVWSILNKFDPVWSSLNIFEQVWSIWIKFKPIWPKWGNKQVWTSLISLNIFEHVWSIWIKFKPIYALFKMKKGEKQNFLKMETTTKVIPRSASRTQSSRLKKVWIDQDIIDSPCCKLNTDSFWSKNLKI